MMEEIELYLDDAKDSMEKVIAHFEKEIQKVRAGKASAAMFDGVMVEYYGAMSPINQVASINTQDAKTLIISPWEKQVLPEIEKAIMKANLGVTPQNDGEIIRIIIPPLTEERRRELVKKVKEISENSKVSIRNIRRDTNDALKKLKNEGVSEDAIKGAEGDVQEITNSFSSRIDKALEVKESEIMTV